MIFVFISKVALIAPVAFLRMMRFLLVPLAVVVLGLSCMAEPTPAPPRHLPFQEAQEIVPFPILVPTHIPKGFELDDKMYILAGWQYGHEVKGVSYDLLQFEPWRKRDIYINQFVAEGTFPPMRVLPDIITYEVRDLDGIFLEVKEVDMGDGVTIGASWEGDHEGKRLFFSVISGASRGETLEMIRSMEPLGATE